MKRIVKDHKSTVSAFEKESKSGKDAEVKSFATETLPTLREHMQTAQAMYDSVKKTDTSTSSNIPSAGNAMPCSPTK
jgi:putative membrane protein